ncbi:hypothetical protein HK100_003959 [Physocladia obscura]|uniref:PHD-type domain-containing protein n=1 Tax=Physocladia obscura TaxID=109957 RepID=A0AAD5XA65_9FUNG|nr:hypothetical protein HK100_003959 [Physocladia obscura]
MDSANKEEAAAHELADSNSNTNSTLSPERAAEQTHGAADDGDGDGSGSEHIQWSDDDPTDDDGDPTDDDDTFAPNARSAGPSKPPVIPLATPPSRPRQIESPFLAKHMPTHSITRSAAASAPPSAKSKHRAPQLWEPVLVDQEVSSYELEREARLAQNRAVLLSLGILKENSIDESSPATSSSVIGTTPKPKKAYRKRSDIDPESYQRMMMDIKRSRRLLGADPEQIRFGKSSELGNPEVFAQAFSDSERSDNDDDDIFDQSGMIGMSKIRKRRLGAGVDLVGGLINDPIHVETPFTLGFTKLTVWNIGSIVTSEKKRDNYWSQRNCRYRHQYPVGYKATKSQYGYEWTMTIEEGDDGPLFKVVSDDESLPEFTGPSPTSPWTEVCMTILGRNSKTRVSGPHQFGFTDPFLQAVIFGLPNHPRITDMTTLRLVSRQARRGVRFGGRDGQKRKRGRPRNGTGLLDALSDNVIVTGGLVDIDWDVVLEEEKVAELARRDERKAKADAEEEIERKKQESNTSNNKTPRKTSHTPTNNAYSTPLRAASLNAKNYSDSQTNGSVILKAENDDTEMVEVEIEVQEEIIDETAVSSEPRIVNGRELRVRKTPKKFRTVIKKVLMPVKKAKTISGSGGGANGRSAGVGGSSRRASAHSTTVAKAVASTPTRTPPTASASPAKIASTTPKSHSKPNPTKPEQIQQELPKPPQEVLARASDPDDDVIYCICELPESDYWATVACDFCNIWLHTECVGYIDPETVENAKHSTIKGLMRDGRWKCPRCRKEVVVLNAVGL